MQAKVATPDAMPQAFTAALASGDLEQLASLYVEKAATRTTEGEIVHGIADIREVLKGLLARKAHFDGKVRWSVTVGDIALIIVDWKRSEIETDGKPRFYAGTSTHVLRQDAGEGWRFLIMNPNGTAEP